MKGKAATGDNTWVILDSAVEAERAAFHEALRGGENSSDLDRLVQAWEQSLANVREAHRQLNPWTMS